MVELLIAMAITLVVLGVLANIFSWLGTSVNDSRATLEMASRLRHVRNQLDADLAGVTCPMQPPVRPEAGLGYFEYVEGPANDIPPVSSSPTSLVPITVLGDYDDVLMFTARSRGEPFVGLGPSGALESQVAEVIWYCVENPPDGSLGEPGMRTLYRRVMLVAPTITTTIASAAIDVSAGMEGGPYKANALSDLTKRERRSFHIPGEFPHSLFPRISGNFRFNGTGITDSVNRFVIAGFRPGMSVLVSGSSDNDSLFYITNVTPGTLTVDRTLVNESGGSATLQGVPVLGGERLGEDVMLTNVLAWDVKAFDSGAPLFQDPSANVILTPNDVGYAAISGTPPPVGFGAYVDLNYFLRDYSGSVTDPQILFAGQQTTVVFTSRWLNSPYARAVRSQLSTPTYDTWSFHYEHDGINQDGDELTDEGTDGFDNWENAAGEHKLAGENGIGMVNGVDDIGERETSPPYPVPLRGIQVKIRVYETDSRAVREVTVQQNFTPE